MKTCVGAKLKITGIFRRFWVDPLLKTLISERGRHDGRLANIKKRGTEAPRPK
jgi:hypothetical protein